ncbi:MAG: hypothetical protein AAGD14_15855 [Planctomycetota bacterium]
MLLIVLVIASAIAGLAAISSGRVVHETRTQRVLEEETRAFNRAYAQLHMAMNVINTSAYNADNKNVALQNAINGVYGGTVTGVKEKTDPLYAYDDEGKLVRAEKPAGIQSGYVAEGDAKQKTVTLDKGSDESWLDDPEGVEFGLLEGTNVRAYRARDYIRRLQKLNGKNVTNVDPGGLTDAFYVIEAAGRSGDTVRLVSALIRESEPFSSFVFFQNRGTLGVSGSPRGLVHSNQTLAFYFANGDYQDPVSAVNGFKYEAGATTENTNIVEGNDAAAPIELEQVDFEDLKGKADVFEGQPGLDAEIFFEGDKVKIKEWSKPRFEMIERSNSYQQYAGFHYETRIVEKPVQVGTETVEYDEDVVTGYETETYTVTEQVQTGTDQETYTVRKKFKIGTETVTKYRTEQRQTGTQTKTLYNQEPIMETRTVTKTRTVKKLVPLSEIDPSAGGGTVGGSGATDIMVEVWVEEQYTVTEDYVAGYRSVPYTVEEPVYETVQVPYEKTQNIYEWRDVEQTRNVPIYEEREVERTREVPIVETVTKTREEPVYEVQPVEEEYKVNDYETITENWVEEVYIKPELIETTEITLQSGSGGTMYIDGRINKLQGKLDGRLTIVANEQVRVTGNIQYVDSNGNTAMSNGTASDYTKKYERNSSYTGNSTLGVISRDDILLTSSIPSYAEVNGTLMSVGGRVGIDGFVTKDTGDLTKSSTKNRERYYTAEQLEAYRAYQKTGWKEKKFKKNALRRIGGVISNNRILETWIRTKKGISEVQHGFVSGNMQFDINLLFNPPPNFVEVPRPVLTYFVPIMLVRDNN